MAPAATSDLSPPLSAAQGLTPEQLRSWHENGYLLIPNYLPLSTVSSMLAETNSLLTSFDITTHPLTKFSTGDGADAHVGDDYFLSSGDKVRFFFEEDAFDSSGKLVKPKERAINKIGHNLHGLSNPFKEATLNARNRAVARDIGFKDARVLQSMVICKQPEIGGAVPPHQDSTFLYTDPPSAVGFWFALEDATKENGCLSFAKGSHRRTEVESRFVRKKSGEGTEFIPPEGEKWPRGLERESKKDGEEEYTMGEVKAGSLVLIHGNLLHKSERNTSQKGRTIYTFHMIEGGETYDERNWLVKPEQGFTKLFGEA